MNGSRRRLVLGAAALAISVLLSGGCGKGPEIGQVEGVVRVKGQPMPNALVQFLADPDRGTHAPTAAAETDAEGHYRLRYYDPKGDAPAEGAVAGWYRVIVFDLVPGQTPDGKQPPPPRLAASYTSAETTSLQFEVKPGPQTIDINVD